MITLPKSVVKMISLNHMHPVTAWRAYYGFSPAEFATRSKLRLDELRKIESSNAHLAPEYLQRLSESLGIYPDALRIRYNNYKM